MVFDSKIHALKMQFGISSPEDWRGISPAQILAQDGIGQATLDHIRLYLASRNITLKDDATPAHWQRYFATTKIGHILGSEDCGEVIPWTVIIDTQEKHPFSFAGISGDSDRDFMPLVIPKRFESLGPANGDYSIEGYQGEVAIERKSMDDAHSTVLGWGDRQERFKRELANLASMRCAAVVVECSFGDLLLNSPQWGKRTSDENRKHLHRLVLSWSQEYRVPWIFCDSRELAEVTTFRILERFMRHEIAGQKQRQRESNREENQAFNQAISNL